MRAFSFLLKMALRLRYPVSLPGDVAEALGIDLSNHISYQEFISKLSCPSCRPTKLTRFMPREEAEEAFRRACRTERFHQNTRCSYYFNEGWLEFSLKFDNESRLRRIYLQHKNIREDRGIEIQLG
jgi:hypothetical protein